VTLTACGSSEPPAAPEAHLVRSMVVDSAASVEAAEYTAEVRSRYETELAFQVGGKVVSRAVDVGAVVKHGQALAQLDDADLKLRVQAARSGVDAAQAELDRARSEEVRYRDLLERGLTTRAAYLTQQTAVKTSKSRLEQATADLRLAEQRLGYATLRAEDDGVVTSVSAEVGSVVGAGQRVVSVARPNVLEAVFDVPDARIGGIRSTAEIELALLDEPARRYAGHVREISPSADQSTRTYKVRASIDAPPPGLRLGMTVSVTLAQAGGALLISLPATALFQSGNAPAVWVVQDDSTLVLRPVEVERYESDVVLVRAGLAAGDRIVTAGVHRLAEHERVRIGEETRP
jgi:membrane fusion protein, multidrug efflux system